ncbi:hypothetical protein GXP67_08265 [Rhodocytophaga rosea]|uniref:Lipoprotein n=1 Tax=Rhodocytophaga rosea TaxID=2704465 RepID=A0A6C0GF61_9BACT|nr:hypothetical protein [Rhodocytophaga rosea]QHT66651.1 hypothetical protein GXP67_08265 [Rhodocytophaga rosea]
MKYLFTCFLLCSLLFSGCESASPKPEYSTGQGVEIYLAKQVNSYKWDIDYSQLNLDTIQLQTKPFLSYNQIKSYNPDNNTATLTIPLSQLSGFQTSVHGHMFVVTVDGKRQYCGFIQPLYSSAYLPWIVINEPLEAEGKDKNLKIHFNSQAANQDPRNNPEIIERLQKDGKLDK